MAKGPVPDLSPDTDEGYELARSYLKRRFAVWAKTNGTELDDDAAETPIHYKWGYVGGGLAHWDRAALDEIYLELYPAKVIAEEDELASVMAEAKAFMRFLDEDGLLDESSEPADVLVAHLDRIERRFYKHMADPARYSFGKRFWTAARDAGVQLDDDKAVNAFMQEFNARPRAEREAVLGKQLKARSGRFTPPGTAPASRRRR